MFFRLKLPVLCSRFSTCRCCAARASSWIQTGVVVEGICHGATCYGHQSSNQNVGINMPKPTWVWKKEHVDQKGCPFKNSFRFLTSLVVPFYRFLPFLTKPTQALGHHTSLLSFSSERRASFRLRSSIGISCPMF